MINKSIAARMPVSVARVFGKLSEEELRVKESLEGLMGVVGSEPEIYRRKSVSAAYKVKKYDGELKKYFEEYLDSVRKCRRELGGYGASSFY